MAHTKAKGTSKLGRDSASQRLGVKKYSGEKVLCGNIIIRQRGTKYYPGENVIIAKDDSIVADTAGKVLFSKKKVKSFTGKVRERIFVSVVR